jgi:hypothetical protein
MRPFPEALSIDSIFSSGKIGGKSRQDIDFQHRYIHDEKNPESIAILAGPDGLHRAAKRAISSNGFALGCQKVPRTFLNSGLEYRDPLRMIRAR